MGYRNLLRSATEAIRGGVAVRIGGAALLGTPVDAPGPEAIVAIRPEDLVTTPTDRLPRPWRSPNTTAATSMRTARSVDGAELYFRSTCRIASGQPVRLDAAPSPCAAVPSRSRMNPAAGANAEFAVGRSRPRRRDPAGDARRRVRGQLFVYPFLYGLWLSFQPRQGRMLANYVTFFSTPFLYDTIGTTLLIAVPATGIADRLDSGRAARAADTTSAAADDHPGDPDHPRHRAGGGGPADLSRSARLAEPTAADGARDR